MWALMKAANPDIQAKHDNDIAVYNKRKKEMEAAGTWDDESEAGPPTLDLFTESDCNYEWTHMTRINALGGTEKTEAWKEKFGRKSDDIFEEGESDEGNSESHAAHADSSTGQGDDADEATENPVADS